MVIRRHLWVKSEAPSIKASYTCTSSTLVGLAEAEPPCCRTKAGAADPVTEFALLDAS